MKAVEFTSQLFHFHVNVLTYFLAYLSTFYQIDKIEVIKHGNAKKHILYIHGF